MSYIYPITLTKTESAHHKTLEISYQSGKKVLNTATTNYSYGSLQKILHLGLLHLKIPPNTKTILVLGMGAGSVVETLRKNFQLTAKITLVDIDSKIIELTHDYFSLNQYSDIEIICEDAFAFIQKTPIIYDIVIVDIFIEDKIPAIFLSEIFIENLIAKTSQKLLFNTLIDTLSEDEFTTVKKYFVDKNFHTQILDNILSTNRLLIVEKKQ